MTINGNDKFTIKELFDLWMKLHRREHDLQEEIIAARDTLRKDALDRQAIEYERRLENLNHSHAQAQENFSKFVSYEKFEVFAQSLNKLDKFTSLLSDKIDNHGQLSMHPGGQTIIEALERKQVENEKEKTARSHWTVERIMAGIAILISFIAIFYSIFK